MTLRICAGWDLGRIGGFSLQFTDTGGSDTIAISTGTYAHESMANVLGSGNYAEFATALQTALNASGTLNGTFAVTWSSVTYQYTIASTVAFTTADPTGTIAGQILGLTGAVASTTSKTSDVRPYYVIDAAMGCKSRASDDYEPPGVAEGDWTIGGSHYSVSVAAAVTFHDFTLTYESKAATFKRAATAAVPWTYQHLWEHCRGSQPLMVTDDVDTAGAVHYLRADGASWKPERAVADWDDAWHLTFNTILKGRVDTSWTPASMTGLHRWWRADTGVTGDPVTNWLDSQASADLEDATSAPDMTTLGGQDALSFVNANNDALHETGSTAAYTYLHDGTGGTAIVVLNNDAVSNGDVLETQTVGSAAEIGFCLRFNAATTFMLRIGNGTGSWMVDTSGSLGSGRHYVVVRTDAAQANDYEVYFDQVTTPDLSGTFTGSPSVSSASDNLTVAAPTTGGTPSGNWDGDIAEIILLDQWATDDDLANLHTYLVSRYGAF